MAGAREQDLVRRSKAGDREAFAALVAEHQRFVYNLALRALGSPPEAEDVAQETFVSAWLALPSFREQAQFQTWLYRIATNLCYKRLPSLQQELAALGEEKITDLPGEPDADPAARIEDSERRAFLHQQIDALPPRYKVLVALRYQRGLACEEIAAILGLPLGTVKTGLFRARARLRQALYVFEGDVDG